MVEVAGYIVVCWLEIIGCAHTKSKNRACQADSDLPWQHEILNMLLDLCSNQHTLHCTGEPKVGSAYLTIL